MYKQVLDPVGDSLFASALVAMIPLATLFVLLGGLKMKSHWAGLISLGVAILTAVLFWSMPFGQAIDVALEGEPPPLGPGRGVEGVEGVIETGRVDDPGDQPRRRLQLSCRRERPACGAGRRVERVDVAVG